MTLVIGRLINRMTLERPSETAGDAAVTWTVIDTVWAELKGIAGSESGLTAQADFRIHCRYREGVTPRMRVGFGARKFAIVSVVDPDGRRRELNIFAQEMV